MKRKVKIDKNRLLSEDIPFTRFAAIDFETADYGRDSACAVSVVVAEKGEIIKKFYSLVRPPRREFVFSYLHGITWKDVAKQPRFGEIWPPIREMFEDVDFIAAHNATFDRSVLYTCCSNAGIAMPEYNFICTVKLARRIWHLFPTKLSDVCNYLSIPLTHHNALSDTLACAKIVLAMKETVVPKSVFLKGRKMQFTHEF